MKHCFFSHLFWLLFLFTASTFSLSAQSTDCNFKSPVIKIDFGDDGHPQNFALSQLKDYYRGTSKDCPDDGEFSFTSKTHDCFNGNWIVMNKDHTPGSVNGRMMVVNASYIPTTFFSVKLTALRPNTQYELSTWLLNICPGTIGCEPTPPQIRVAIFADEKLLSKFYTGPVSPTESPAWKKFAGMFTTPSSFSSISVVMDDQTSGGCGNDFAMDDIEIRECRLIKAVVKPEPPIVISKPVQKPVVKEEPKELPAKPAITQKEISVVNKTAVEKQPESIKPIIKKPVAASLPVPAILKTRDNSLAQKIETPETEMLIELYDNGEIDGDTVTIYHNNQLVVSHAGLSIKPVTLKITVDDKSPHHELIMVADNLGSIPPNTSLMVITTKYKRYEVFISSSEQKNAKVVIDLKSD